MLHGLPAVGLNDIRNIRRDSLLVYAVTVPWLLVLLVRLLVPSITTWLAERYAFDLEPYYALILSFFFILEIPLIFGVVMGLLLLDERDDDTLTALRVTPLSLEGYLAYRIGMAVLFSVVSILAMLPLTGLLDLSLVPAIIPIALVGGMIAPLLTMFLAAFAGNKLEGLALMKGFGILMLGPLAAFFIESRWQVLFGILPSYWPARAFWTAWEGGVFWPFLLAGVVYMAALLGWFLRRFQARVARS